MTTPGSEGDRELMAEIHRLYALAVPIVRELRHDPDYVESDVYENFIEEQKMHTLTPGPLRGSRGVAFQV